MFVFFVFSSIVACVFSAAVPEGAAVVAPQLDGRIIGGTPASIQSYPYQVALLKYDRNHCGGSVYTERIVLTAAHCLYRGFSSQFKVRAGSTYSNNGGVLVGVSSIRIHPQYNDDTVVNDIGLVFLSSPLPFGSTIRSIPLATSSPANGATAVVTGWGRTSPNGYAASQLQMASMDIIGRTECASRQYRYGSEIRSGMICATNRGKDSCQGDSGGPLVSNGVQVGVVSWGRGCAQSRYPGVYADVAFYRSWILSNS